MRLTAASYDHHLGAYVLKAVYEISCSPIKVLWTQIYALLILCKLICNPF